MLQNPFVQCSNKNRKQPEKDGAYEKSPGTKSQTRGPATSSAGGCSPIAASTEGAGFY